MTRQEDNCVSGVKILCEPKGQESKRRVMAAGLEQMIIHFLPPPHPTKNITV